MPALSREVNAIPIYFLMQTLHVLLNSVSKLHKRLKDCFKYLLQRFLSCSCRHEMVKVLFLYNFAFSETYSAKGGLEHLVETLAR